MPLNTTSHNHTAGDMTRLNKLIKDRLQPGADKAEIDARIWELFGAEWTVMFTDLVGFSRRVAEFGIIHFLQVIHEAERLFIPCIDKWDGSLVKVEGDSMLIIFRRPREAVACAIEMQRAASRYNEGIHEAEKVLVCVGIGTGRVLRIGDEDVFGAEVNAAAKLGEDIAHAWEILVTDSVAVQLRDVENISLEAMDFVPHGAKAAFRLKYSLDD